jgi:hypothetical protein
VERGGWVGVRGGFARLGRLGRWGALRLGGGRLFGFGPVGEGSGGGGAG